MWQCPKCKSTKLFVTVRVWATLTQSPGGSFVTDTSDSDYRPSEEHQWDENSEMRCWRCDHKAPASDFYLDPAAPLLTEVQRLQSAFWQKVRELEKALGDTVEIDDTTDLKGLTVAEVRDLFTAAPEHQNPYLSRKPDCSEEERNG